MDIKKIQQSKKYQNLIKKDAKHLKTFKTIYSFKEIKLYTGLSKEYKNIFKRYSKLETIINKLLDTLMTSSSYFERLTMIKNKLLELKRIVIIDKDKILNIAYRHPEFLALRKQDKDIIIKTLLIDFKVEKDINNALLIVDNTLMNLDKLQFNLKSAIAILKVKFEKFHA